MMKHVRGDGSLPLETFRGGLPGGAAKSGQKRLAWRYVIFGKSTKSLTGNV
jgi:hypothetical protein